MKSQKRPKLFAPGYIGTLELKNRVIMPAMGTNLGTPSGSTTERMVDYYAERARGGVGLIIVEATTVEFPRGKVGPVTLSIHDDALLPAHNWLVETVHREGARIALQNSMQVCGPIRNSAAGNRSHRRRFPVRF